MSRRGGLVLDAVDKQGPAWRAGLRPGDVLLSINGTRLSDAIDYMFCLEGSALDVRYIRADIPEETQVTRASEEEPWGMEPGEFKVLPCNNKCVFCFVHQQPRGLRKTLYIKDDDYRMSFLYGNYVTLSNLTPAQKSRIVELRLSPLYVSVHATNNALRRKMLGNAKAPDIMKELGFFARHRIRMHTQIVLCPGYNDGAELKRTLTDLYSLHPYVVSIAVVPVGLTSHRKAQLTPVGRKEAQEALALVAAFQKRFQKKHGDPIVYAADELYIKAGEPFPDVKHYGEFHQIENGVGMVPSFLAESRKLRMEPAPEGKAAPKRFLTFTGESFHPYLQRFLERFGRKGYEVDCVKVENRFFGSEVTVAGLLTGRDVLYALGQYEDKYDALIIPDVVLRSGQDVLLDDLSVAELSKALGQEALVAESTPEGFYRAITENMK